MVEITITQLQEEIAASKLSQAEIAQRAAISQSTLSRVLAGRTGNPHQATLQRIRDALRIESEAPSKPPRVFISYSWSSPAHREVVQQWAEQLMADGVDVILDVFDLKEGQDKFAFMERMVVDPNVTHVLVICDKTYAEKANARKAGVGTESQIISKEVYEKVEQSKFIPIVCEFSDNEQAYLPAFLQSRIWVDFSSPQAVSDNWERLIRLLFGSPLHQKPKLGKPPAYIVDQTSAPSSPVLAKYNSLKQAILQGKKGLPLYRRDFLDACINYADELRVRQRPDVQILGQKVLEDCATLSHVRDHIVDWILFESEAAPSEEFCETVLNFLERLRELKSRPAGVNTWNDAWFEAHSLFVYETFLYIIAALLKTGSFAYLREIFTTHYLLPQSERYSGRTFDTFSCFYGYSETLQAVLAPEGKRLYSPAAELIKRQANREDIPLKALIEADILVLLIALIRPDVRWYPQTFHYNSHGGELPFFLRATQQKHFQKLAIITGIDDPNKLREHVKAGHERLKVSEWHDFFFPESFWFAMNMDKLGTLK